MNSARLARQAALVLGGSAIVVMGALTSGCSTSTKEEPKTTSTPTSAPATSAPVLTPSEKAAGGPNSFSPTITAPNPGGNCVHVSTNGICTR